MLIVEKSNAFTNQYLGILLILAFTPNSIEVLSLSIFTFNARHKARRLFAVALNAVVRHSCDPTCASRSQKNSG